MIIDKFFARELAGALIDINAVILRPDKPFTWASGWKAPVYCDNRLTMLYPELRQRITEKMAETITARYPDTDVITGTATSGIPYAAWIAERLHKPMAYVRAKAKQHGKEKQIEGGIRQGQSTVVIEDLISTGGSALSVAQTLRSNSIRVSALLALFTYDFKTATRNIAEEQLPCHVLTDYDTLLQIAIEKEKINENDLELLHQWRQSPHTWGRTSD